MRIFPSNLGWCSRDSLFLETLVLTGKMGSRLRLDAFYGPDFPHQSLPRSDAGEAIGSAGLPFYR